MDSIPEHGKLGRSNTFPEASKPSQKEEPTTRARFTEEVVEQTGATDPQTSHDRKRTRSSHSQRNHSHSAAFGNATQRGNRRSNDRHGTVASSDGSFEDSFRPSLLPSLTYPFKLKKDNVEEEGGQEKAAAASATRNNDPQKEKEYRRKLYHEHIQDFSYSRYIGGSRSHEDSTAELCTTNLQETERRGRVGILKWMLPVFDEVNLPSSSDSTSDEDASDYADPQDHPRSRKASAKSANSTTSTFSAQTSLRLDVRRGSQASPGLKESLPGATKATPSRSTSKGIESLESRADEENVFSWFAAVPNTSPKRNTVGRAEYKEKMEEKPSYVIDKSWIEDNLAEMHSSLSSSRFRRYREYRKCPMATVEDVNATLARVVANDREASSEHDEQSKHSASFTDSEDSEVVSRHFDTHAKKSFVRTMKVIFKFFLPLEQTSEMVAKYWGAVNRLIQVRDPYKNNKGKSGSDWNRGGVFAYRALKDRSVPGFLPYAPQPAQDTWHCKYLHGFLSQVPPTSLPESLLLSWQPAVMFLVLNVAQKTDQALAELAKFREMAYGSREQVMKSFARGSLHDREAVLPLGVATLVIKNLLEDVTFGAPDITSIYLEAFEKLTEEVQTNPYTRDHQEKIVRFQQEIVSDLSYSFARPREASILKECKAAIRNRIQRFEEMNEQAAELISWHTRRIESNKDRHEAAVLVFTTVTVIFLPLSFVSSIFGMNTKDIRNMDKSQWVFWVSAIPMTIIVIGLALFVIRYFDSARQALGSFWYHNAAETQGAAEPSPQRSAIQQTRQAQEIHAHPGPRVDRKVVDVSRPTFIKVHRKHMSPDTLDAYDLPWEWDDRDSNYLIIRRWISEPEQDRLFEHTRRLHEEGEMTNATIELRKEAGKLRLILSVCIYRLTIHPLAKYPGPRSAALTDWYTIYHQFIGDRHIDFYNLHHRYGPIVRFGPNRISINSATALRDIYSTRANVQKSSVYSSYKHFFSGIDMSMTTIDRKKHAYKRRVNAQALTSAAIKSLEERILRNVRVFCDSLVEERSVMEWSSPKDMTRHIGWLVSDIMGDVTFSKNWEVQRSARYRKFVEDGPLGVAGIHLTGHMPFLLHFGLDRLLFRPLIEGTRQLNQLSKSITDWRVGQGDILDGQDLFSHLLRARDPETGDTLTHEEMVAEAGLFIVAGTDTTITAISATLFYLLKNLTALRKVYSEIRTAFQALEDIRIGPKLEGCNYLTACIQESLRICPPTGSLLPREVLPGGITVDGESFPAGVDIGVPHFALHHNEGYFPEPFRYRPERWIDCDEATAIAQSDAFAAFGVGRTSCIGKNLAYQEIRLVLGRLVWLYDMRLANGKQNAESKNMAVGRIGKGARGDKHEWNEEFPTLDRFVSMHKGPMPSLIDCSPTFFFGDTTVLIMEKAERDPKASTYNDEHHSTCLPANQHALQRSWIFHMHTLWLFTKSDLKTVMAPSTIFAICCGLAEHAAQDPSVNIPKLLPKLFKRLPHVLIWTWSNLLVEDLANQRLPASILEDSLNKPWRPLPSNRISPEETRHLLLWLLPVVTLLSWHLNVAKESILGFVFIWMYNDLEGSGEGWFIRNALNAIALANWDAAATAIILKRNGSAELANRTWLWLYAVVAVMLTTVQVQDLPDMHGDRAADRKTMPLVVGENVTRWLTAVVVMVWSFILPRIWDLEPLGYVLMMATGSPGDFGADG
ncbi:MAG: hypothetical protein Q9184_004061 [Pyrenodesmia sp. 2 TL-2023]